MENTIENETFQTTTPIQSPPPLKFSRFNKLTGEFTGTGINLEHPPLLRTPTSGYLRTIQRRGNSYMLRDTMSSSEDDQLEGDSTDDMINDLYEESLTLSASASSKSNLFKSIYIISSITITIFGVVVGVLSLIDDGKRNLSAAAIIAALMGFTITAIQTLMSTFAIEKRGVLLKDVSNKLRKVSRQIKTLQSSDLPPEIKLKKLEEYYTEVNELDLSIFDHNITTSSVDKATNITRESGKTPRKGTPDNDFYEKTRSSSPSPKPSFLTRMLSHRSMPTTQTPNTPENIV